jgi:hypothetical protein
MSGTTGDEQARGRAEIERGPGRRRERAGDELEGHQPLDPVAHHRRRQRHEAPVDRRHRLSARDGDRPPVHRRGDAAGQRVLLDGEVDDRGERVERDHLAAVDYAGRQLAALGRCHQRQRSLWWSLGEDQGRQQAQDGAGEQRGSRAHRPNSRTPFAKPTGAPAALGVA